MVERLMRSALSFVVVAILTLLLPFLCTAAWLWGSDDDKSLMKGLFCLLSPFSACVWYVLLSDLVFGRKSSYFVQFLIFLGSAAGVYVLLASGVIRF